MSSKKIWIKANGNGIIATGHIRRCMSIAKEFIQKGMEVTFALSDEQSANILKTLSDEEGSFFEGVILHTNYSEPSEDIELLKDIFVEEKPDLFLIDTYFVTPDYFEQLKKMLDEVSPDTKLAYIDDLYKFDYPVDIIINYDIEIPEDFYGAPIKLLGPEYSPIREQFAQNDYVIRDRAQKAFLSAGGTDPYHVLGDILKEIYYDDSPCRGVLDLTGITCEVIVGALFEDDYKKELEEMASKDSRINIHEAVDNMANIMKDCDFAVSAGGTTLYELCAVGVPTVVFSMADNQVDFAMTFDKKGAAKYAGDARKDHRLVQKIVTWGTAAVENPGFRKRMSDTARGLIDGMGAKRIADVIVERI
ncbi:UDP-2,4-diacetamido-2,4,6-trideoxy-beta-L-altropyranose hydrolase [Butyrivibrio proteoclasticus]|uniref:UDP-2,4-diacetamido-2,4, 6-trideoxy-beta-L-altropyranose hydrolase n=1 Tax=Butyrivibrio proteoclasticus TaxID=43305 RepID=UPI0004790907|nr:UDP-2,4-diacetamido-2,4,6-trideoxy-beta-L-altropyranose hydrolase [Butyrivibrio proteoclasticus]